jgi:hypothetical protein
MPKNRRPRFVDTRLTVDTGGNWKAHTDTVPKGCEVLGTVTLGASDTGALVRLADSRNFVRVNAGKVAMLNQRQVITALQMAERENYAPEMVSVDEWERSQPPRIEDSQHRTGSAGGITRAASLQPAPLAPRKLGE